MAMAGDLPAAEATLRASIRELEAMGESGTRQRTPAYSPTTSAIRSTSTPLFRPMLMVALWVG
jgi:hypothetical protein